VPSTVENLSPVLLELNVTVPAAEVDRAVDRAIARLARETKLPGFRRGKVPRSVIQRMFGKALLADLRGELVTQGYLEALAEHGLEPVAEPEIDGERLAEVARGQDFQFTVAIATAPRLEQVSYDGIELQRYRIEIPADRIDAEIEKLRRGLAVVAELPEPRPARVGDLVRTELERWSDGQWQRSGTPIDELVLEPGEIREEFVAALSGAVPGDEREIELPGPGEQGAGLRFRAKVVGVQERRLPDLDDDFAKDVGDFETLSALRAGVESRLREAAEEQERKRLRHALFEALRGVNPLELPDALVRRQTQAMQHRFQDLFKLDVEGTEIGDGEQAVREALAAGAEKTAREVVHQHFLTRELARLGQLELTEAEVEEELGRIASRSGMSLPRLRAEISKDGRRAELMSRLLEDKVFAFALDRVKVVETDAPPPDAGGKDEP
jgi:trigger factor